MSFLGELGGFFAILYIVISVIARPFLAYLSKLEAIEEIFKVKTLN